MGWPASSESWRLLLSNALETFSGLLGLPDPDFQSLAIALNAEQLSNGEWFFPCESTLSFDMNGSQNRVYTILLADPTQPLSSNPNLCAALINDEGDSDVK